MYMYFYVQSALIVYTAYEEVKWCKVTCTGATHVWCRQTEVGAEAVQWGAVVGAVRLAVAVIHVYCHRDLEHTLFHHQRDRIRNAEKMHQASTININMHD